MFSEWIRRTAYWTLDFLIGSKVRKHYDDIKNIMENGEKPDVIQLKEKYLDNILKYATENVEFYKKNKSYSSLKDFPIINKSIIKDHYEKFQSTEYKNARVFKMHTSGSTGTPFIVRQNTYKRNRVFAEMIYFWGKAGYQIGMKYVYFRIWTSVNRKSKISAWARNIMMWDIVRLDEDKLEKIRENLKTDHKIKMLLGYASTYENLANYLFECDDTPDMFSIKTIISCAESLPDITRQRLEKVFGCVVISLYSNSENGMIAQEYIENKEFHINSASFYVELLKFDSNDSVSLGEQGRIVITDLFNNAMPLIRYDTGDVGTWKKGAEFSLSTEIMSSVEGRKVDFIYDTKGNKLSPHTITNYMWPFDKIMQFQFIQEGEKQYIIKLNGAEGHYEDVEFVNLFENILGEDSEIIIEHVSEIPVLSSGKRKKVVCNYKGEI